MYFVCCDKIDVSKIGVEYRLPLGKEHHQMEDERYPYNTGDVSPKEDCFHWIRIVQIK
jgi:hypothetical protein